MDFKRLNLVKPMRLVFNYEIIDIDFVESKDEPGEYIFTVKSQVHGQ